MTNRRSARGCSATQKEKSPTAFPHGRGRFFVRLDWTIASLPVYIILRFPEKINSFRKFSVRLAFAGKCRIIYVLSHSLRAVLQRKGGDDSAAYFFDFSRVIYLLIFCSRKN